MSSRRLKYVPRHPAVSDILREVRNDHRGYQRFGRTALDLNRAFGRETHLFELDELLTDLSGPWVIHMTPAYPTRSQFSASRARLRSDYPRDAPLLRDLRQVRYNPDGPVGATDLTTAVFRAAAVFRADIDASSGRGGRKGKKRERARAWARFHETLSAVALASASDLGSDAEDLTRVASGALR
jgi:hypothetical protein